VQASNTTDDTFLKGIVRDYGIKWTHDYQNETRLISDGFNVLGDIGLPKGGPSTSTPAEYAASVKAKMLANPDVHVWTTGDVPDQKLWDGSFYVEYVKAGYAALKSTRPNDIPIGGIPPSPIQYDGLLASWNISWLQAIADAGGAKCMDAVGVDIYCGSNNFANVSSVLDKIHSVFNLPVAITEFGSQSPEPNKSDFLKGIVPIFLSKDYIKYMMYYQLIDQPNYPPPNGSFFGLFNASLVPYPAATAYKDLIATEILATGDPTVDKYDDLIIQWGTYGQKNLGLPLSVKLSTNGETILYLFFLKGQVANESYFNPNLATYNDYWKINDVGLMQNNANQIHAMFPNDSVAQALTQEELASDP
jgi:hypothetical protein